MSGSELQTLLAQIGSVRNAAIIDASPICSDMNHLLMLQMSFDNLGRDRPQFFLHGRELMSKVMAYNHTAISHETLEYEHFLPHDA